VTRLAVVAGAVLALSTALAAAAPPPRTATTGSSAALIRIVIPGQDSIAVGELEWPTNLNADVQSFAYPDDGSIIRIGRSKAQVSAQPGQSAASQALAEVIVLSLFNGEVTAAQVTASTSAGASVRSAGGTADASSVQGLRALESDVSTSPGATAALSDWGILTVLSETSGSAPTGPPRAQSDVVALRVQLLAEHGGLPAGSEIVVGTAHTVAVAAPGKPPRPGKRPEPPPDDPSPPTAPAPEPETTDEPVPGGPVLVAPEVSARLSAGGYVFPIFGPVSFGDSFGAPRANIPGGWHHGEDIFAPMGAPILAVADGTIHTVGFIKLGGYRFWLRDDSGNEFYYAHLSAYTPLAVDGRRVEAGDVIGFVGDTGDADGGSPHLHFEIHPAAMLGLGYDGVVAPYPILMAWRRAADISFSAGRIFVPTGPEAHALPSPGAVLLQADDISPTSGLVPNGLERALMDERPQAPGG
jgi:murein DD-endopeptidase MepM/ murein hydrolase activator NlpD